MSYVYVYKFPDSDGYEREIGIHVNTLDDMLDLDNKFYKRHNNGHHSWFSFFKDMLFKVETKKVNKHPRKRLANEMAKEIAIMFFEVLLEDMLYNKVTYQFPYRFFAKMGIREIDWREQEDITKLWYPEVCIEFTKGGRKRMKRTRYYTKLTERWRNRLAVLEDQGQAFPKYEYDA